MIVGYYKNYLYTTDKVSSEKKKKKKNKEESQYMVSHPETGSDSPIGSDQYRGRDITFQLDHTTRFLLQYFVFLNIWFCN